VPRSVRSAAGFAVHRPRPDQLEAFARGRCPGRRAAHRCLRGDDGRAAGDGVARLVEAARYGSRIGLTVHAGHGLHYHNVQPVAAVAEIVELNIGHAIVARAVVDGIGAAVREMKALMDAARRGAHGAA